MKQADYRDSIRTGTYLIIRRCLNMLRYRIGLSRARDYK